MVPCSEMGGYFIYFVSHGSGTERVLRCRILSGNCLPQQLEGDKYLWAVPHDVGTTLIERSETTFGEGTREHHRKHPRSHVSLSPPEWPYLLPTPF